MRVDAWRDTAFLHRRRSAWTDQGLESSRRRTPPILLARTWLRCSARGSGRCLDPDRRFRTSDRHHRGCQNPNTASRSYRRVEASIAHYPTGNGSKPSHASRLCRAPRPPVVKDRGICQGAASGCVVACCDCSKRRGNGSRATRRRLGQGCIQTSAPQPRRRKMSAEFERRSVRRNGDQSVDAMVGRATVRTRGLGIKWPDATLAEQRLETGER